MTPSKLASKTAAGSDPVESLDTGLAQTISHLHPLLILTIYRYQFSVLVQDPVRQLLNSLPLLCILQIIYMMACFPPAWRDEMNPTSKSSQRKGHRSTKQEAPNAKLIIPALLSVLLALLLGTPVVTIAMILLGAPLTTHLPHTTLASAHFSLLAIMPMVYVYGADINKWQEIIALMRPLDEVFGATLGTFLGAWLGAIPIPLDWDRDWQKWPVTIVTGAYVGHVLGKYLGRYAFRGKRIEFE